MNFMGEEEISSFLGENYAIEFDGADVLRDGPDNLVWVFEKGGEKKYVVRISKRDIRDGIDFEIEWLTFLAGKNMPVVPPIETNGGRGYAITPTGSIITVFPFVNGKHIVASGSEPKKPIVLNAAVALAKIHNASRNRTAHAKRKRTIFSELERAISHKRRIEEKMSGGTWLMSEVEEYLAWGRGERYNPVLVHNDYRPGNILVGDNNEIVAVLDFDWSCMGPAAKDVGHALAEWSYPDGAAEHSKGTFTAFLDEYNKATDEKIKSPDNLARWIAFSCLSDTCTYLVDRLERGEIKNPDDSYMYQKFRYFSKKQ